MTADTLIIVFGLLLNAVGTVGALFRFAMMNERRMVRMETLLEHIVPRVRHTDLEK